MVRLTVDYGYDIHSIDLDDDVYAKIKAGEKIQIDGQGFFHEVDGEVQDFWSFNANVGEIGFMLDNGAEFHALDYWIEEYQGAAWFKADHGVCGASGGGQSRHNSAGCGAASRREPTALREQ